MFRKLMIAAAAFGLMAMSQLGIAEAKKAYTFDKTHTHITFAVSHLGFSRTLGMFKTFDGTIDFDAEKPAKTSLSFTIETASIDTGYGPRDEHLRKADFFNVEAHPTMTFVSKSVEVTGEKTAKLTGDLTLLGVTKPVTLDVTLNGMGSHPFRQGTEVVGFAANGTIKRSDFGMGYGLPAIGDEVEIYVETELNTAAK